MKAFPWKPFLPAAARESSIKTGVEISEVEADIQVGRNDHGKLRPQTSIHPVSIQISMLDEKIER